MIKIIKTLKDHKQWFIHSLTVVGILASSGCDQPLETVYLDAPAFDEDTTTKLQQTHPANLDEILAAKNLELTDATEPGFITQSPYAPAHPLSEEDCQDNPNCSYSKEVLKRKSTEFPAREDVYQWWTTRNLTADSAQVCGVRFLDEDQEAYELKTFNNLGELLSADGYKLTHYHACGTCSTLQDLAIYGTLDLTEMAKTCSKRLSLSAKKSCMMDIGFTEPCADTWAYNARKTSQSCMIQCIKEYGLINILTGNESSPPVNENGELNACLLCDEMMAGPGFQYAAGRTRRSSGIESEIERPDEEVYTVEHDYFTDQD